jgi:hypothetical protein
MANPYVLPVAIMKYRIPSAGIAGYLLDRAVVWIIPVCVGESPGG